MWNASNEKQLVYSTARFNKEYMYIGGGSILNVRGPRQ
jgi:hypothetical protein